MLLVRFYQQFFGTVICAILVFLAILVQKVIYVSFPKCFFVTLTRHM